MQLYIQTRYVAFESYKILENLINEDFNANAIYAKNYVENKLEIMPEINEPPSISPEPCLKVCITFRIYISL